MELKEQEKNNRKYDGKAKSGHKDHDHRMNLKKLYWSVLICLLFMTAEIVGGVVSKSLAILTDAAHVFSDILGFCISIISMHITKRPASVVMSYGFHRAEVIGALLSIALIWGLTAWLLSESIHRIIHPSDVDGFIMFITSTCGLAGNIIMGLILGHHHHDHHHMDESLSKTKKASPESKEKDPINYQEVLVPPKSKKNLNMRAALLHVLGDTLQSIGVIIASIIIYFKPEYSQADPICTITFSIIVMFTTIPIVKDSIRVLMEGTPSEINLSEITFALKEVFRI